MLGVCTEADKQVQTQVQRHRKTSGQWGGLCSGCKVVWETILGLFGRSSHGSKRELLRLPCAASKVAKKQTIRENVWIVPSMVLTLHTVYKTFHP